MTTRTNIKRLRTLSRILFEADEIPFFRRIFTMAAWGFSLHSDSAVVPDCGTPACAMGHYAARTDVQRSFYLSGEGKVLNASTQSKFRVDADAGTSMREHFGITDGESSDLFGSSGCGDAKRPKEAARFIEKFAAKLEKRHGLA